MYLIRPFLSFYYKILFIIHNKKKFSFLKIKTNKKILVEINNFYPSMIVVPYLLLALQKFFKANTLGYLPNFNSGFKSLLTRYAIIFFPLSRFSIYKSFGVSSVLNNKLNNIQLINLTNKIYKKITQVSSKKYFLQFRYENVLIGDLIYDSFLRFEAKHTTHIKNPEFKKFVYQQILIFAYWLNIFKKYKISALVLSHTVYMLALPLRIAVTRNVPSYIATLTSINLYNNKRCYEFDDQAINQNFINLNKDIKKKYLEYSKKKIKEKFNAKSKFFVVLSKIDESSILIKKNKFIFWIKNNNNLILNNKKKNIIIYAHCFYDAPHIVRHLFLDFYDWLDFLGKVSIQTDYNWFIKLHPHTLNPQLSNIVFEDLLKKYPKFNILDKKITTGEIITKADLILTIYGSAAFEFAYFKKKVLLGSPYTHYKNYNFCLQPKNKKQYLYFIKNLGKIKIKFNQKEIYQFYLNAVLSHTNPFNILSERKNLNKDFFRPRIFKSLIDKFDEKKHILFSDNCSKFVRSKKFRLIDFPN